eukprot:1144641-Pelagomonas_calceolata.AAC.5
MKCGLTGGLGSSSTRTPSPTLQIMEASSSSWQLRGRMVVVGALPFVVFCIGTAAEAAPGPAAAEAAPDPAAAEAALDPAAAEAAPEPAAAEAAPDPAAAEAAPDPAAAEAAPDPAAAPNPAATEAAPDTAAAAPEPAADAASWPLMPRAGPAASKASAGRAASGSNRDPKKRVVGSSTAFLCLQEGMHAHAQCCALIDQSQLQKRSEGRRQGQQAG